MVNDGNVRADDGKLLGVTKYLSPVVWCRITCETEP